MGEGVGHGVAHLDVGQGLDAAGHVAHLAHAQVVGLGHLGAEHAHLVHPVLAAGDHEVHGLPGLQGAVHDAHQAHHPAVLVVVAVEHQRLEGGLGVALGGGHALDDLLQHRQAVLAGLGRYIDGVRRIHQADDRVDLLQHPLGIAGGQVGLVEHREDFQVVLQGQVGVGQGLGLHPLGGVHHQDGPLAGGQAAAHLVGEVHVPRGVDEVESVDLSVQRRVLQGHGVGLDGDAPLPLQFHVVQDLGLHVAHGDGVGELQQPVGQGRLAVVDVRDDREIANEIGVGHTWPQRSEPSIVSLEPWYVCFSLGCCVFPPWPGWSGAA